jgi:hypothetical protein
VKAQGWSITKSTYTANLAQDYPWRPELWCDLFAIIAGNCEKDKVAVGEGG